MGSWPEISLTLMRLRAGERNLRDAADPARICPARPMQPLPGVALQEVHLGREEARFPLVGAQARGVAVGQVQVNGDILAMLRLPGQRDTVHLVALVGNVLVQVVDHAECGVDGFVHKAGGHRCEHMLGDVRSSILLELVHPELAGGQLPVSRHDIAVQPTGGLAMGIGR